MSHSNKAHPVPPGPTGHAKWSRHTVQCPETAKAYIIKGPMPPRYCPGCGDRLPILTIEGPR